MSRRNAASMLCVFAKNYIGLKSKLLNGGFHNEKIIIFFNFIFVFN